MELNEAMEHWLAEKGWAVNDDVYISHKLMFHYALLVNPNQGGYEQRYCFKNLELLVRAMEEFKTTGKLRYWHKDHSKNISVVDNQMYAAGDQQVPENSIGEVDWIVDKVSDYP